MRFSLGFWGKTIAFCLVALWGANLAAQAPYPACPVSALPACPAGVALNLAAAGSLTRNGAAQSCQLGGRHRYTSVAITGGARIVVTPFNGTDRINTGNLELVADSITVDATSTITARGSGYCAQRCGDGPGPNATAGGQGGCAVRDSGGGGAHFGAGGRGTKDCFVFGSAVSCQFPQEYEEDCGNSLNAGGTACSNTTSCWNTATCADCDGVPTIAGQSFWHSIWGIEFGASGADKGCRDGDGFGTNPNVAGFGGGRIALAAVNAAQTGTITIQGTIEANGKRGCGIGNDSAGGGAGGSVLIVGDTVTIAANSTISAKGGLGGDTRAGAVGQPDQADCPSGTQTSGTCDDCGGGGGGGIISVLSRTTTIDPAANFNIAGAAGGTCTICQGEAGGGAGELQLNIAYTGEFCDGFDNDFDGMVDEGLGTTTCGLGTCATSGPACISGAPPMCMPVVSGPSCQAASACNKPRVAVILDTSASMLQDLSGNPTFGDGSTGHAGLNTNGDGLPNDSRLLLAKESLGQVISSYPEIEFALARYHQDQGVNRSCQLATWIECAGIFATYDNPNDNSGTVICGKSVPSVNIRQNDTTPDEQCINYAGSCGAPRRGADVLAGFGTDARDVVRWFNGTENTTNIGVITTGNFCNHQSGGDCEIRGTGPTPLEGSLQAMEDYIIPARATDPCSACRGYSIILVTDGVESCGGTPATQAMRLFQTLGLKVYVIAVSVLASEQAALNAIASAGGTTAATFVNNPQDLVPALVSIISSAIRFERCNGVDDDCDTNVDEGFLGLGTTCFDNGVGACRGSGTIQCRGDQTGTACVINMPGASPGMETSSSCNNIDEDCDARIDEGLSCVGSSCTPTMPPDEVCDGVDNNCDGLIDETDPAAGTPCGSAEGICMPGELRCVQGMLECLGGAGPRDEVCNGLDDNCDGVLDNDAPCPNNLMCVDGACRSPCDQNLEFPCPVGQQCVMRPPLVGTFCVPTPCAVCTIEQKCVADACVDRCEGVTCEANELCVRGICRDCHVLGCPTGQICYAGQCIVDPCADVTCGQTEVCFNGTCQPACSDTSCPGGQRCAETGLCEADPCANVNCNTGQACVDGACRSNPCNFVTCPQGDVCIAERGCIDDPCPVVRCPNGEKCEVSASGSVECAISTSTDRYVLATGRGGSNVCSLTDAPSQATAPPFAIALLLSIAALALRARRRRS